MGDLHLCLFTDSLEPSGVGEHVLALGRHLRAEYRITFACPETEAGLKLLRKGGEAGLAMLPLPVHREGIAPRLAELFDRDPVDVFHCHAGIAREGHSGVEAAARADVPLIVRTEHLPNVLSDPADKAAHARMLACVDHVVCVSHRTAGTFRSTGALAPISVVHNGVVVPALLPPRATARRAIGVEDDRPLLVNVARFTRQKGHAVLLAAMPEVIRRHPRAELLLVGNGPLERELHAHVEALGIGQHVRFLGRREDVFALLRAADVFVLPSIFEGLPLVVLEAMATSTAVVATRESGSEEAVTHGITGLLVRRGDPAALAAAVAGLLHTPLIRARYAAAGRARAARDFTAARMAAETSDVYRMAWEQRRCRERRTA